MTLQITSCMNGPNREEGSGISIGTLFLLKISMNSLKICLVLPECHVKRGTLITEQQTSISMKEGGHNRDRERAN